MLTVTKRPRASRNYGMVLRASSHTAFPTEIDLPLWPELLNYHISPAATIESSMLILLTSTTFCQGFLDIKHKPSRVRLGLCFVLSPTYGMGLIGPAPH